MYELIYNSIAKDNMSDVMLNDVLSSARKNNEKYGITGLLVFDGEMFFQILEGEKQNVLHIYETIKLDNRHHAINLYHAGEIEKRSFSEWSMSYQYLKDKASVAGWLEWFQAQNIIEKISRTDTLGCRVFKLAYNA